MIQKHPSAHRGTTDIGWLNGKHSFSFGSYYDPRYPGVANLRVLNHDVIAPSGGFAPHPHRDMEIVTIVLRGSVRHADNAGNEGLISPDKIQAMSAGSGIVHSEYNGSDKDELELLQIWLHPTRTGLPPQYAESASSPAARDNTWETLASGRAADGLTIHADATILRAAVTVGKNVSYALEDRPGYLYVINGSVRLGAHTLASGDAAIVKEEQMLTIYSEKDADLILFDLAKTTVTN